MTIINVAGLDASGSKPPSANNYGGDEEKQGLPSEEKIVPPTMDTKGPNPKPETVQQVNMNLFKKLR